MADTHTKDPSWTVDLIWHYLHESKKPVTSVGQWHSKLDPLGLLNVRHRVYEILVDEPVHTNPPDDPAVKKSMIPWNQRNEGIVQSCKSEKACGTVVKLSFVKYMGWGMDEPTTRDVTHRGFDAAKWIASSLSALKPVRIFLPGLNHRVGVVGFRTIGNLAAKRRAQYEFLVMEPWSGGAATAAVTLNYGGRDTAFLGTMKDDGSKLTYDGDEVSEVGGHHPF